MSRLPKTALAELVKKAKEANDTDRWWEFADKLDEEVREAIGEPREVSPSRGKSDVNDDSYAVLEEIADEILEQIGIRYTVNRLRILRATAIAWPHGTRDHEVEFAVHEMLRGPKLKPKLAQYKRRAAADHKRAPGFIRSPRLTQHRVRFYRAEERPPVRRAEARAARIRSLVQAALADHELDELEAVFAQAVREARR
jgi:hypothetical protein